MRVKYDVDTQLIIQIGDPIDHSTAAFLHNAMYDLANMNAICLPMLVKKENLEEFVQMIRTFKIAGFTITMPHKTAVIPLLDEVEETSRIFGSVNHVKNENGKLIGIGLDGVGMAAAIEEKMGSVKGKKVLLLGAGSVSGPIGADLCKRGADEVYVANRTVDRAKKTAEVIHDYFGVKTEYGELNDIFLSEAAKKADIVVQCTSLGMMGTNRDFESLAFMKNLKKDAVCADVLYPTTSFLEKAKELGLVTINGMAMLLSQQIEGLDFHFGVRVDKECLKIAEESLVCAVALRDLREERIKMSL